MVKPPEHHVHFAVFGFCLSASVVQRVAALGLGVDFDLYCLGGAGDAS